MILIDQLSSGNDQQFMFPVHFAWELYYVPCSTAAVLAWSVAPSLPDVPDWLRLGGRVVMKVNVENWLLTSADWSRAESKLPLTFWSFNSKYGQVATVTDQSLKVEKRKWQSHVSYWSRVDKLVALWIQSFFDSFVQSFLFWIGIFLFQFLISLLIQNIDRYLRPRNAQTTSLTLFMMGKNHLPIVLCHKVPIIAPAPTWHCAPLAHGALFLYLHNSFTSFSIGPVIDLIIWNPFINLVRVALSVATHLE